MGEDCHGLGEGSVKIWGKEGIKTKETVEVLYINCVSAKEDE